MNSESQLTFKLMLAIETSGDICSAAVLLDGDCRAQYSFTHSMHLSERLPGIIDQLLKEVDSTIGDVDAFAVGIGPGSFTGTRIGVMTAKTLALVQQRPIIVIDTLKAMAYVYTGLQDTLVVPMLPCRKEIVFCGLYRVDGVSPIEIEAPEARALSDLSDIIRSHNGCSVILYGAAALEHGAALVEQLADMGRPVSVLSADFAQARSIGILAAERFQAGDAPDDALTLLPLYLAPPPISTPKKPFAFQLS